MNMLKITLITCLSLFFAWYAVGARVKPAGFIFFVMVGILCVSVGIWRGVRLFEIDPISILLLGPADFFLVDMYVVGGYGLIAGSILAVVFSYLTSQEDRQHVIVKQEPEEPSTLGNFVKHYFTSLCLYFFGALAVYAIVRAWIIY